MYVNKKTACQTSQAVFYLKFVIWGCYARLVSLLSRATVKIIAPTTTKIPSMPLPIMPSAGSKYSGVKFILSASLFYQSQNQAAFNNRSDLNLGPVARMNCNQLYGKWNGDVTLDDGTKLEIKDLFAFCEYVENRW